MDKLERIKQENADNSAVTDDVTGRTTCLEFAEEIFSLAEKAVDGDRVTKQTADKFLAAATFFDLQKIWGKPNQETAAKTKYSKWLASEIIKAIREGRDPNDVNPRKKVATASQDEKGGLPSLDPNDPEVRMLVGSDSGTAAVDKIDATQSFERPFSSHDAPSVSKSNEIENLSHRGESCLGSVSVCLAQESHLAPSFPSNVRTTPGQMSPFAPHEMTSSSYFPIVHSPTLSVSSVSPVQSMPNAPEYPPQVPQPGSSGIKDHDLSIPSHSSSQQMPLQQTSYPASPPTTFAPPSFQQHLSGEYLSQPSTASSIPHVHPQITPTASESVPVIQEQHYGHQKYTTSEAKITEAQKHAKWAVSALNFDDVPTAVKELRIALNELLD